MLTMMMRFLLMRWWEGHVSSHDFLSLLYSTSLVFPAFSCLNSCQLCNYMSVTPRTVSLQQGTLDLRAHASVATYFIAFADSAVRLDYSNLNEFT